MISTSEQSAKHPFAGLDKQHLLYGVHLILFDTLYLAWSNNSKLIEIRGDRNSKQKVCTLNCKQSESTLATTEAIKDDQNIVNFKLGF